MRMCRHAADAEDVAQGTFAQAYRAIASFRGESKFTTWLYRITANCSANLLAKRARTRSETLSDDELVVDARPEADPEGCMAGADAG